MKKQYKLRFVKVDNFVAESLEREAGLMPPSKKKDADLLREQPKN